MGKYGRRKKLFIKLMSSVSSLPITLSERRKMAKKGIAPDGYNIHHVLPRQFSGEDEINNFALIKITDHEKLHDSLDHILLAQPEGFTREDIPYLKTWTKHHGGFTLDDIKKGNEVALYAS